MNHVRHSDQPFGNAFMATKQILNKYGSLAAMGM